MGNYLVYALWAFAAGVVIPVMMVFNAHLARSLGGAPATLPPLFFISFAVSLAYVLVSRPAGMNMAAVLHAPPQYFVGGLIVVFYMISATYLAPRFGVGNTVMFVVLAQLCASTAIDGWGLFGAPVRSISAMRVFGLALIMVGVVVAQYAATLSQRR